MTLRKIDYMKYKLTSLIAALSLLALSPGIASAGYLSFDFNNTGTIDVTGTCSPNCYELQSTGYAYEIGSDEVPGTNSWTFTGSMKFYTNPFGGVGIGSTPGYGWAFTDNSASNDLFGSFSTVLLGSNPGIGQVAYTIEGGNGLFAGATGSGASTLLTLKNWFSDTYNFFETGRMYVYTPPTGTNVPEPGMTGLLAAGLVMVGFVAWRRRRPALRTQ